MSAQTESAVERINKKLAWFIVCNDLLVVYWHMLISLVLHGGL